ncbi:MAG: cell envelope integrity protein TolA [Gammaproteobacteria bacterium]|nr:cell envelope integrity protein TolA [Gammaproteobacteria bacterium]MCK5262086.1 cell envelope integrity protein TolA [Gammaproteobacteria bacterium]
MNSSDLLNDVKKKPIVLLAVIALHFVLIVLLGVNLSSSEIHKPASSDKKTVKAVVVDAAKIEAEAKKLKQAEDKKKKKNLAQQKKIKQQQDKAKKQLAAEKKRLADLKKKQVTEKKRLANLKKKNLAEKKRIEAENKKAETARKKVEAEKRKLEEDKRKREEVEARRQLEEDNRRKAEADELQRKLADEERMEEEARQAKEKNARLQSLRSQYVRLIEQKVERNWLRPATSTSDMSCEVIVTQTSLGDVIDVRLKKCVNDLAFQRSIERAVRKASPLPPPPNPEVFDREIHFTFKPRN